MLPLAHDEQDTDIVNRQIRPRKHEVKLVIQRLETTQLPQQYRYDQVCIKLSRKMDASIIAIRKAATSFRVMSENGTGSTCNTNCSS